MKELTIIRQAIDKAIQSGAYSLDEVAVIINALGVVLEANNPESNKAEKEKPSK